MEFKPIQFRQPIVGDARCALYSMANLLGDRSLLFFNNVNKSTNYLQEARYLNLWRSAVNAKGVNPLYHICNIYPFAIAAPTQRIVLDKTLIDNLQPDPDKYILALIDFKRAEGYHTMGCLWGYGEECYLLDPQHEFVTPFEKELLFKTFEVVGMRWLTGGSDFPLEFFPRNLSHIFKLD